MRPGASPVVVSIAASDAMTLTTSAPSRTTRRVAVTNASGPSASSPNWNPCPPVTPTAVPAATRRGPGIRPAAIASRSTTSRLRMEPAPRAVVTPARSARAA